MKEGRKAESREGLLDGIKEGPGVYFFYRQESGPEVGRVGAGGIPL